MPKKQETAHKTEEKTVVKKTSVSKRKFNALGSSITGTGNKNKKARVDTKPNARAPREFSFARPTTSSASRAIASTKLRQARAKAALKKTKPFSFARPTALSATGSRTTAAKVKASRASMPARKIQVKMKKMTRPSLPLKVESTLSPAETKFDANDSKPSPMKEEKREDAATNEGNNSIETESLEVKEQNQLEFKKEEIKSQRLAAQQTFATPGDVRITAIRYAAAPINHPTFSSIIGVVFVLERQYCCGQHQLMVVGPLPVPVIEERGSMWGKNEMVCIDNDEVVSDW